MDTICDGTVLFEDALRAAAGGAAARGGGLVGRDLLVLLKLAAAGTEETVAAMAAELGLPAAEVSLGLERCRRVGLVDGEKRRVMKEPLLEFLAHGARFVFPAAPGAVARGIATAALAGRFVWRSAEGGAHGRALEPLDPAAPRAAVLDPRLHELLALVDVLRAGAERERAIAARELGRRFV